MMRVLLADDQPEVRLALRLFIEQEPGDWTVIGDAPTVEALFEQAEVSEPDLLLLDWELPSSAPDQDGTAVIQAIRRLHPALYIIVLSLRSKDRIAALSAGAGSFVSKWDPADGLRTALWGAAGAADKQDNLQSWPPDQDVFPPVA